MPDTNGRWVNVANGYGTRCRCIGFRTVESVSEGYGGFLRCDDAGLSHCVLNENAIFVEHGEEEYERGEEGPPDFFVVALLCLCIGFGSRYRFHLI